MTALLVFGGAAVGSVLRFLVDRLLRSRWDTAFPWPTLAVNVVGSFALGLLVGAQPWLWALLGAGFCGGLTTYSTFSLENVTLVERGRPWLALGYASLTLVAGIAAAALGWALAR
ncbi:MULTISPECIES: CrcB family protein [Actinosynnema]|uniref:fluoride efflux transporter FluC n=1 Tax=Actinosynnema TaxID=40566 RepID=UPI0020A509B1|nr:CrcB family protein [Actinosynnema pretiosum]MCP2093086.1 CrcB protein [Actinosynnema pretiosum]